MIINDNFYVFYVKGDESIKVYAGFMEEYTAEVLSIALSARLNVDVDYMQTEPSFDRIVEIAQGKTVDLPKKSIFDIPVPTPRQRNVVDKRNSSAYDELEGFSDEDAEEYEMTPEWENIHITKTPPSGPKQD